MGSSLDETPEVVTVSALQQTPPKPHTHAEREKESERERGGGEGVPSRESGRQLNLGKFWTKIISRFY